MFEFSEACSKQKVGFIDDIKAPWHLVAVLTGDFVGEANLKILAQMSGEIAVEFGRSVAAPFLDLRAGALLLPGVSALDAAG